MIFPFFFLLSVLCKYRFVTHTDGNFGVVEQLSWRLLLVLGLVFCFEVLCLKRSFNSFGF